MSVRYRGAAVVIFATVVLAFSSAADAGWGWFANSGGGYGSGGYAGYGSAGYGSGGWGSHGGRVGLFRRHHTRLAYGSGGWGSYGGGHYVSYGSAGNYGYASAGSYRAYSYGSYGGASYSASYGSVGSTVSYGSSACYSAAPVVSDSYSVGVQDSAACCGGENVTGSYSEGAVMEGATVVEGVPLEGAAPATEMKSEEGAGAEKTDDPTPAADDEASLDAESTMISVSVPEDAEVFVNGYRTQSTGTERRFVSSGLEAGRTYAFEVRAAAVRNGREVTDSKVLHVTAGERNEVAFGLKSAAQVESTLTLHVPVNAEVTLAGSPTRIGGETRVFRTTQLDTNETWENYTVQVTWEDNGQKQTQEKVITLTGGESREMSFGSDDSAVAMAR